MGATACGRTDYRTGEEPAGKWGVMERRCYATRVHRRDGTTQSGLGRLCSFAASRWLGLRYPRPGCAQNVRFVVAPEHLYDPR